MRTYQQKFRYEDLESINPPTPATQSSNSIASAAKALWQALMSSLVIGSELQVRKATDSLGQTWWRVYDPITNASADLVSEDDVRVWIEESYYRKSDRFEQPIR